MLSWDQSIEIQASIEKIWSLLQSEDRQTIMPGVVNTKLIQADETANIYLYEQTYQEGKRQETYELTEQILLDTPQQKRKTFAFTIGGMIHTEAVFDLMKLTNERTVFHYSGTNTGESFLGRMMLKMASNAKNDQTVEKFLHLMKQESEK